MKFLTIVFILCSIAAVAQTADTVSLQPTLEKALLENAKKIEQHKAAIAELEKLNSKWFRVIVETGKIDTTRIAEQPIYIPGKMIFKLKPKK